MVWQYEEYYPGCPYLRDWVRNEFVFGIEVGESLSHVTTEDVVVAGKTIEAQVMHGDGVPQPRFYLMGNKSDRPHQLSLTLSGGLVKKIISTTDEGEKGNFRVINLKTRPLGMGGFEDFKAMGNYAVERFPKIAQEIVLPPTNFLNDVPTEDWDNILKFREQCLSVSDWEGTAKEISQRFYLLFSLHAIAKVDSKGPSLRIGDDKFTVKELREIHTLIKPLRDFSSPNNYGL